MPRSDCTSAQSDPGLRCPFKEYLNAVEYNVEYCIDLQQRPLSDCVTSVAKLDIYFSCMPYPPPPATDPRRHPFSQRSQVMCVNRLTRVTLRKHAYLNILKISPSKTESFLIKILIFFFIFFAQNIDCGYSLEPPRRDGSNEYPQSMILSRNKTNNIYSCKPQFYYIKVGFKGVKII